MATARAASGYAAIIEAERHFPMQERAHLYYGGLEVKKESQFDQQPSQNEQQRLCLPQK